MPEYIDLSHKIYVNIRSDGPFHKNTILKDLDAGLKGTLIHTIFIWLMIL